MLAMIVSVALLTPSHELPEPGTYTVQVSQECRRYDPKLGAVKDVIKQVDWVSRGRVKLLLLAPDSKVRPDIVIAAEPLHPALKKAQKDSAARITGVLIRHKRGRVVVGGDIILDSPLGITSDRLLAHEFGHFLGLEHVSDFSDIMHPNPRYDLPRLFGKKNRKNLDRFFGSP